jgi:hypothetical protein
VLYFNIKSTFNYKKKPAVLKTQFILPCSVVAFEALPLFGEDGSSEFFQPCSSEYMADALS